MDIFIEFLKAIPPGGWVCIALGVVIAIFDDTKVFTIAYNLAIWSIILVCGTIVLMALLYKLLGVALLAVGIFAALLVTRISPTARRTLLPIILAVLGLGIYLVFFS